MADWYDENAERYDLLEPGLPGDAAFYMSLARACAPPVLELGCGTGRVALEIAAAGIPTVGLDRSPGMLRVAARKAAGREPAAWVVGDMRAFGFRRPFGLICIPHRGFLHALTRADQEAVLRCCVHHLRPGGRLALNVANPPLPLLTRAGAHGGGALFGTPHRGLRIRYVRADEMRDLLRAAGLTVEVLYGWFDGRPFVSTSTEQVWVARRGA
jgi:SAM-dependent methyltransferase